MIFSEMLWADKLALWPGLSQKELFENCQTLDYIAELASNASFDIDHWDVPAIFGLEGHKLVTDKKEIHHRFFNLYRKEREDFAPQLKVLAEKAAKEAAAFFPGLETRHLDQLKLQIAQNEQSAMNAFCTAEGHIKTINLIQRKIDGLSGKVYDFEKEIRDVIEQLPFFKFHQIGNGRIQFLTRHQIVLTEKNPAAGINLSVNLGRFKILYFPKEAELRVEPFRNNVKVGHYFHPHVNGEGQICFGDQQKAFTKAVGQGDLVAAFTCVMQGLSHFNPGNPYVALVSFHQQREANLKKKGIEARVRDPDRPAQQGPRVGDVPLVDPEVARLEVARRALREIREEQARRDLNSLVQEVDWVRPASLGGYRVELVAMGENIVAEPEGR